MPKTFVKESVPTNVHKSYKFWDMPMRREKIFWCMALIVVSLIISFPLYSTNVRLYDDLAFHLGRILSIANGLSAGEFPVRMYSYGLAGYGTPTGLFYPDIYMYIPALLYMCGLNLELSYNIYCIFLNFATAFIGWRAYTIILGSFRMGAVASLLYLTTFYRLMEFYAHGGLGTLTALAFFPLVFAGLISIFRQNDSQWILFTAGMSGIILSHIISATLAALGTVVFIVAWWLFGSRDSRRLKIFCKSVLFTILLTGWFVFPFLEAYSTMDFNIKSGGDLSNGPIFDRALTPWLFFNVQALIGWPLAILTLLTGWRLLFTTRIGKYKFYLSLIFFSIVCLWLGTQFFPWELVEPLPIIGYIFKTIQFPWRITCLVVTVLPVIATWLLYGVVRKNFYRVTTERILAAACVVMALCPLLYMYADPFAKDEPSWFASRLNVNPEQMNGILGYWWDNSNDYLYAGIKFIDLRNNHGEPLNGNEFYGENQISKVVRRGSLVSFISQNYTAAYSLEQLPLFYFKGYEAKTEYGEKLNLTESTEHYLCVYLPPGEHKVEVKYVGTTVTQISGWISLVAWFWLIIFYVRRGMASKSR